MLMNRRKDYLASVQLLKEIKQFDKIYIIHVLQTVLLYAAKILSNQAQRFFHVVKAIVTENCQVMVEHFYTEQSVCASAYTKQMYGKLLVAYYLF